MEMACAKIGSPSGGPKDASPPRVIKTSPPDSTINFVPKKKISITFDEYIELKDIFQELIISPPVGENAMAYTKGKSIVVEFPKDIIYDTATYTLSFGNSITDINEGNILKNYEFIFSLKNYIDSMNVEGRVVNSFNHVADKDRMYVMLYKNLNDSAPLKEKPKYICRTDDTGNFSLHNLETGFYRLFALKDVNSNMIYDLPNEQIAFADSFLELTPERFINNKIINDSTWLNKPDHVDSTSYDSLSVDSSEFIVHDNKYYFVKTSSTNFTDLSNGDDRGKSNIKMGEQGITSTNEMRQSNSPLVDTIKTDTLKAPRKYVYSTEMGFFTQEIKNQYITNNLRPQPEMMLFSFNQSLRDSLLLEPLNFNPSGKWYILDANKSFDTLKYWLIDTSMISKDSLQFKVCYSAYDSTGQIVKKADTLYMVNQPLARQGEKRTKRNRGKDKEKEETQPEKKIKRLALTNNVKNISAFDLNYNIEIKTNTPTFDIRTEKIRMYKLEDTLEIPIKTNIVRDANWLYGIKINYKPEELMHYKVFIPDSTLFDIYGTTNDTTIFQFTTQAADFYGTLTLRLSNIKGPVILQLLDENENLVNEKLFSSDQIIRYEYLYPKKYILKLIIDSNNNGRWDTGNYLQKLQPEKVMYFPQSINVRSNWEVDFKWEL
jgi:hypothetical protein